MAMPFFFMLGAQLYSTPFARRGWLLAALSMWLSACGSHAGSKQEATGNDCAACHADEATETTQPSHLQAMFGEDCASCHDDNRWSPALGFVHTVSFPLTLGHDGPACLSCHAQTFAPSAVPNDCAACHAERAAAVSNPIHAGLSPNCVACHNTEAFSPTMFVHSWPLEGAHTQVACTGCHSGMPAQYEGTAKACASCHVDDRAVADARVQGHSGFPATCESCHKVDAF